MLIKKNIPQNKININTHLQTIADSTTLRKIESIRSLYILPHDNINQKELNNFNSHNIIWRSKITN